MRRHRGPRRPRAAADRPTTTPTSPRRSPTASAPTFRVEHVRRRRRSEPRGPGAGRPPRRARPRRAHGAHRRRPGRDRCCSHLLRGAGATRPGGDAARAARPILALRRSRDRRALCAQLGLERRRGSDNDDPRFRRNRVRHELLPLLDDVADRDVAVAARPNRRPAPRRRPVPRRPRRRHRPDRRAERSPPHRRRSPAGRSGGGSSTERLPARRRRRASGCSASPAAMPPPARSPAGGAGAPASGACSRRRDVSPEAVAWPTGHGQP